MDHLEMVEKLREKANVTYEEAKNALEASDYDILDALVLLESQGKVNKEEGAHFSTEEKKAEASNTKHQKSHNFGQTLKKIIDQGNNNFFVAKHNEDELFRLPLTAFIIILCFLFYPLLIGAIIALFFSVRFSFVGPLFNKPTVNNVMDKAADVAENIKQKVEEKTP